MSSAPAINPPTRPPYFGAQSEVSMYSGSIAFWRVKADVEVGAGDYRQLWHTGWFEGLWLAFSGEIGP